MFSFCGVRATNPSQKCLRTAATGGLVASRTRRSLGVVPPLFSQKQARCYITIVVPLLLLYLSHERSFAWGLMYERELGDISCVRARVNLLCRLACWSTFFVTPEHQHCSADRAPRCACNCNI